MSDFNIYALEEQISEMEYITATYYCEFPEDIDIVAKAKSFAVGQTIGTWLPVPGVTPEMHEKHMGRAVGFYEAPPTELKNQIAEGKRAFFIQIAYPTVNFGSDFPMLLTTLLGNDASTSTQAKLVDLKLTRKFAEGFGGPNLGIEGVKDAVGIHDRPIVMSMIKPCTGFTPEAGAEIFYKAAIGGVEIIKDDELLGDTEFSSCIDRVKAYNAAADRVYDEIGFRPLYIVNITGSPDTIIDKALRCVDAGARGVMAAYAAVGYGTFNGLAKALKGSGCLLMGHYASSGMSFEGVYSGMASYLACGRFPRLAGCDLIMSNTPFGGYPLQYDKYMRIIHHLTLPLYDIKPTMPIIGGGVHPGMTEQFIDDCGKDIILAAGGAIHGFPDGPDKGAKAMRQSIDAVMQGVPLNEYAKDHEELKKALDMWGYIKGKR